MNNNNKPIIECVRQFKLRQQYPSMIKQSKNEKTVILNGSLKSVIPANAKIKLKMNAQPKNGIHKLRLKLPSGKDLGECNVQMLPSNNNNLKDKIVTVINRNKCKTANKPVILLSTKLRNKTNSVVANKHLQSINSTSQRNVVTSNDANHMIKNIDTDITDKECNKNGRFEHCHIQKTLEKDKQLTNENAVLELSNYLSFSINKSNAVNKTVESNSSTANSDSQNDQLEKEELCLLSKDDETSLLNNGMKKVHEINSKPLNNKTQINENQSNAEQNTDKSLQGNLPDENVSVKKTCSSCSVLKEVMNIIHNENLKAKALKAFADCGIEMEQQNLSVPQKDTAASSNIKVQTETYSLMDSENFFNAKKDIHNTVEMTSNKLYFANILENINVSPLHYTPFYKNFTFSPFNQLQEPNTFLDNPIDGDVIDDICNKHSTANKIKEVLTQPNTFCNKIFEQLQRDFETVREWDENGMLNIHKAVISNRIYDIQRHLMVLKACNVNVDIPTQSGMTSLELAIKHNVSTEVVKMLLEAGANPTSFQPIHESALILASKMSSSLLPLLINHVPSSRLLDHVDFTGFAALHYCAQYGNLEGVISLIKMGANVNLQESRSGRTPLFLCIENNHHVIAEKLLDHGAQAHIPNFSGQTVMSLVEKVKHLSLVTMLHTMT